MKHHEFYSILTALAKLVCHSQIEQKELVKSFRFILVHIARKEFPELTISELAQKIGMRREAISECLDETEPQRVISKDSIILSELWRNRDKDNKIPLKDGKHSFYATAKLTLNSAYTPDATLKALIEAQSIEICDEGNMLLIHTAKMEINKVSKDMIQYIGYVLENHVDTGLYNCDESHVDKFFDLTYRTTRTPPKNLRRTHEQVKSFINETAWYTIKDIVDNNEIDVPAGTYPEYSITIFEHKDKNR